MRLLLKYCPFIFLILTLSCDKPGMFASCNDCESSEPSQVSLKVKIDPFSVTNYHSWVDIYEGNIEDDVLIGTYTSDTSPLSIKVWINKKYTLAATYYGNGIYYVAIDSATPRVRYESDMCDNPCYLVYDNNVDLRLKYRP